MRLLFKLISKEKIQNCWHELVTSFGRECRVIKLTLSNHFVLFIVIFQCEKGLCQKDQCQKDDDNERGTRIRNVGRQAGKQFSVTWKYFVL